MRKLSLLALMGLALLLVCSIPVTSVEKAIDTSFVVDQSAQEYYHTHIFAKSALRGEISVEGKGIYLSVNGYNTQHLQNVLVRGQYSFMIDPADDLYVFSFNNTEGRRECSAEFRLEEILTRPIALSSHQGLIMGLTGFSLFFAGMLGLAIKGLKMMIDRSDEGNALGLCSRLRKEMGGARILLLRRLMLAW